MKSLNEELAGRYTDAVMSVLAEHFTELRDDSLLARTLPRDIRQQTIDPSGRFEVIVTYTREWRLHQDVTSFGAWRVVIHCHKDEWTDEDLSFLNHVNTRLRAITMEDNQ
jgi:hypothetical protein